jgi:hypothetical protein
VQSLSCQDHRKVFVTGFSGGARMTSALACFAADVVTAVVVDAGLRAGAPRQGTGGEPEPDPSTCNPARPLPVIAIHGTADATNPYDGGGTADWQYTVPQALARWAVLLGCAPEPVTSQNATQVDQLTYSGCAGSSTLRFYRVNGGQHVWYADPGQIETSAVVADTVSRYTIAPPKVSALRVTCVRGKPRIRVSTVTDSPLSAMVVIVNGKRVARTSAATLDKRVTPGPGRRNETTVLLVDKAGLSGKKTGRSASCAH